MRGFPAKIRSDVTANRTAAMKPQALTIIGNTRGALTSASETAHSAAPAANDGALASSDIAAPDKIRVWPTVKTTKPVATVSCVDVCGRD